MNVPDSAKNIALKDGFLFAKEALEPFAYKTRQHAQMIKKTRIFNWYKEEMFVRIAVL